MFKDVYVLSLTTWLITHWIEEATLAIIIPKNLNVIFRGLWPLPFSLFFPGIRKHIEFIEMMNIPAPFPNNFDDDDEVVGKEHLLSEMSKVAFQIHCLFTSETMWKREIFWRADILKFRSLDWQLETSLREQRRKSSFFCCSSYKSPNVDVSLNICWVTKGKND